MKRFILIAGIAYFTFGFLFTAYAYSFTLRRFDCADATAPNGYVGMGPHGWYRNPDQTRCKRNGLELRSLIGIPTLIAIGPTVLAARFVHAVYMGYIGPFRSA